MHEDVLSEVLTLARLSGALMFRMRCDGSWCVQAQPSAAAFAPVMAADTNQLTAFHIVIQGRCWVRAESQDWQPIEAGEAVVLPRGGAT